MDQPLQFQEVTAVLKRLLKERGLTYRGLAKKLSLSESSVKKLFISKDCSFQRISEICSILEVSMSDVMTSIQEAPIRSYRHSEEQEEFLIRNPQAFHVYWKIVYEEMSVAEVKREFKMTEASLFKILRSLDQHHLIQLMPNGEARYPDMGMVLWENAGPLIAKVKREWPLKLLRMLEGNENKAGYRLSLRTYRMKQSTLTEFMTALSELEFEFARRSRREERLERDLTVPVAALVAMAPRSFVETI